jgi:hypothetical protein
MFFLLITRCSCMNKWCVPYEQKLWGVDFTPMIWSFTSSALINIAHSRWIEFILEYFEKVYFIRSPSSVLATKIELFYVVSVWFLKLAAQIISQIYEEEKRVYFANFTSQRQTPYSHYSWCQKKKEHYSWWFFNIPINWLCLLLMRWAMEVTKLSRLLDV